MRRARTNLWWIAAAALAGAGAATAQEGGRTKDATKERAAAEDRTAPLPRQVQGLDVDEHVGRYLPMELQFTNAQGKRVQLGDYFKSNKPAVIAMVYYRCPLVCDIVMQAMADSFNGMDFTIGKDFNALLFSFDPSETAEQAAGVKKAYLMGYKHPVTPEVEAGWEFHVSDVDAAHQLADAVGFKYRSLPNGQFSHPVAIFVITPEGKISRYFYGYKYPSRDMKLALIDATNGKLVKTVGDRLMSFCYMYDPKSGSYTLAAVRVMQIGGALCAVMVGGLIGALFVGERMRKRALARGAGQAGVQGGGSTDSSSSLNGTSA